MSTIKTNDVTSSSVGNVKQPKKSSKVQKSPTTPKDQLKHIKEQKKQLNVLIKGLDKQEKRVRKELGKGKKSKKTVK